MLTFKQIEALYWTVRLGTFLAAAERLHTGQSAITKRIQELEADFNVQLFDRSGHKASLTSKGHEVFLMAEQMLAHRDRLLVQLEGQHTLTGTLRFGITEITAMTWLPAFIKTMRTHYPWVTLEPLIDLGGDLHRQLASGHIDMAFLNDRLQDPLLDSVPLANLEFAWMCAPGQVDPTMTYTPAQLAEMPLLRQSRESGLNPVYDAWLHPHVPEKNLFTINSLIAMAGLTAAGFGISCLPREYFASMVRGRQLEIVRTTTAAPHTRYVAMFRRDASAAFYENVAKLAQECCDFAKLGD